MDFLRRYGEKRNFVFVGEAGSGKSEIAVNLALLLARGSGREVHFFDLDMTKPIFRSRDLTEKLRHNGVTVHFEQQFMDAPTLTGGVVRCLKDDSCLCVLDVGGSEAGARAIGGYASWLNRDESCCFYVVNNYRPWSMDIGHIDAVLTQILGVSHIELRQLRFVGNPNLGPGTTAEEFLAGRRELKTVLEPYVPIAFYCARQEICPELTEAGEVLPLRLEMTYEWQS